MSQNGRHILNTLIFGKLDWSGHAVNITSQDLIGKVSPTDKMQMIIHPLTPDSSFSQVALQGLFFNDGLTLYRSSAVALIKGFVHLI